MKRFGLGRKYFQVTWTGRRGAGTKAVAVRLRLHATYRTTPLHCPSFFLSRAPGIQPAIRLG